MSAPLTLLISKSDLVGVVPQFTANIDTNHFAAARKFANERFKNLVPSALYEAVIDVYALTAWSNAATYTSGQKVVLSDRGYEANQSTSAGQSPLTHPAKWDEIEMYSVWRDYIKPFLCWQAYAKFLPFHGTFVSQGGMKQHVDLSSEPVPADKLGIAIQNAQSTADGYYMDFQKYLSDNANTIDSVAYVFTGTTTFRPKIGIRMIKTILLFLLPLVAEAQYYPLPIVHEPKNYHFQKKVYVDQKLKIGDPGDPVINRKLHVVADTIRFEGLDGTGPYLTIDANGDVIKGTVGATGVTGLTDQTILYGSPTGTLDYETAFTYDEDLNMMTMANGVIYIDGTGLNDAFISETGFAVQELSAGIEYIGELYSDNLHLGVDGKDTYIYRASGGSDYNLYLPNAQGSAGTFLKNDGSGNLTWAAGGTGTVTSIATTSPITGGTITGTGTIGINNAAADGSTKGAASFTANDFDASSGNISIDYTNGQKATTSTIGFLTDTDWDTFNNKVSFDITGQSSETTIAHDDEIPIYDVSEAAINKITAEDALAGFNRPDALRNYKFTYFNEFLNTVGTATGGNDLIATNSGTGAGTNNQATDASNRVGLIRSTTGTTATGRTSPSTSPNACAFGGGTWVYEIEIKLAALSTVTQRYQLVIGFLDVQNAANQTDAIAFVYDEGGVSTGSAASANWQTLTSSNSTRTWTTTGTAVATGWTNLRIEVNAGASSVTYYVNGVAMGTSHTTNIPSGTARATGFGYLMIKSIGTTASTMDVDYIFCESDFTTNR